MQPVNSPPSAFFLSHSLCLSDTHTHTHKHILKLQMYSICSIIASFPVRTWNEHGVPSCQLSGTTSLYAVPYYISLFGRGILEQYIFAHFVSAFLKPLQHSSDFLSLVSFFSLQQPHTPPPPTIPLLPSLSPCRIVSLTELSCSQSQTAWAKPNTQGTHTHTNMLTPPIIP